MLRALEADLENMELLKDLNRAIIRAVLRTERDIARHKNQAKSLNTSLRNDRPNKEDASSIRRRIKSSKTRSENYTKQLWLWRLFGDAIAHLYLDKYAIKHTFFETENYDVKPHAGMMGGKSGLVREVSVLLDALTHNVPAILCDCTNVLRYGDVCLLGNSDPYLIEVKSSARLNQRGKRQAASLKKLQDFLDTDAATNFRGNPGEVRRHTIAIPEHAHLNLLNECVDAAALHGGKAVSPERGLNYVAMYNSARTATVMAEMALREGVNIYCSWNDAKNASNWTYYVPFLLTIRNPQRLYDFIEGRLIIMIYMNANVLADHLSGDGWKALVLEDGDYIALCHHAESGGVMALSRQMAHRIFYECTSIEWMGQSQIKAMEDAVMTTKNSSDPDQSFDLQSYVEQHFGISYDALMAEFDRARCGEPIEAQKSIRMVEFFPPVLHPSP